MNKAYKGRYLKVKHDRHVMHKIILILLVTLFAMTGFTLHYKSLALMRLQAIENNTEQIVNMMEEDLIDKELNSSLTEQLLELRTDVLLPTEAQHDMGRYVYGRFKEEFGSAVARQALRIVSCESSWNAKAKHTNTNLSTDYGLWQLNSIHGIADDVRLDPYQSTELAINMYRVSGFSPWVCN